MPELPDRSSQRLWKYRLLGGCPGWRGHHYRRKLRRFRAIEAVEQAVSSSAGKTCIDLGANVGEVTRRMAETAGHVFAFEPDPWAIERLRANVRGLGNVTVIPSAAGTRDGTANLHRHPLFADDPARHSTGSTLLAGTRNVANGGAVEVLQVNFPRWLEELSGDVWLLKIDIEGAEFDLLNAMFDRPDLLARIDCIAVETHERFFPDPQTRIAALHARARQTGHPNIHLDWN